MDSTCKAIVVVRERVRLDKLPNLCNQEMIHILLGAFDSQEFQHQVHYKSYPSRIGNMPHGLLAD